jgi:16S rRNA (uracil1498-N3)-methyltransferase
MRLTRVYVDQRLRAPGEVLLEGNASNHVARVLRLRRGDNLSLFNGDGWEYSGTLSDAGHGRVAVQLAGRSLGLPDSPLALTLVQGIARGERMDVVVQKATELGVARIVPVLAERGVVRLDGSQARRKRAHWLAVAIAACEQCGRARLPDIEEPVPLADWLRRSPGPGSRLLLAPGPNPALGTLPAGTTAAALLVGPEGGLTDAERDAAMAAGFAPRSMGPRILRTETAAIVALAIMQARAGDLG